MSILHCVFHFMFVLEPVYKSSFYVLSNITTIFLDWNQSFQLNGQLKEFVLSERGQRLYSGLDSSVHIQKTTDKSKCLLIL